MFCILYSGSNQSLVDDFNSAIDILPALKREAFSSILRKGYPTRTTTTVTRYLGDRNNE